MKNYNNLTYIIRSHAEMQRDSLLPQTVPINKHYTNPALSSYLLYCAWSFFESVWSLVEYLSRSFSSVHCGIVLPLYCLLSPILYHFSRASSSTCPSLYRHLLRICHFLHGSIVFEWSSPHSSLSHLFSSLPPCSVYQIQSFPASIHFTTLCHIRVRKLALMELLLRVCLIDVKYSWRWVCFEKLFWNILLQ